MDGGIKLEEKIEDIVERKLAERGHEAPSAVEMVDRTSTRDASDSTTSPTRRGVLGAGGAGLAGLLLGSSATGTASAQAAGSIGTSESPVDVYASDLVAESADIGQLASSLDAAGSAITNLPTPEDAGDAAPKAYVDQQGGGGDPAAVEGISSAGRHVGPFCEGEYHQSDGAGIVFWAEEGLTLESAVVDTDLSAVSTSTLTVTLAEYDGGAADPPIVGSTDVEVGGGKERIDLSGLPAVPADGEYVLARTPSPNGDEVPCRRIHADDWSASRWDEHTYERIDFRQGTHIDESGDFGAENYYYYFFDVEIGPATPRVTSPRSTDVEEIYVRPTDPTEEFDDVSPRAIWIDTSE